MGIGDLFKRFKRNAAEYEEYREGMVQPQEAGESQAERAAHEGAHAPLDKAKLHWRTSSTAFGALMG